MSRKTEKKRRRIAEKKQSALLFLSVDRISENMLGLTFFSTLPTIERTEKTKRLRGNGGASLSQVMDAS